MSEEVKFVKSLYSTLSSHPVSPLVQALKSLYLLYCTLEIYELVMKALRKPRLKYVPVYMFMPLLYLVMFALTCAADKEASK